MSLRTIDILSVRGAIVAAVSAWNRFRAAKLIRKEIACDLCGKGSRHLSTRGADPLYDGPPGWNAWREYGRYIHVCVECQSRPAWRADVHKRFNKTEQYE